MVGFVYLIGTPIFKWYKIGKSLSPEIRVQDIGVLLPFKIRVIGVWRAEDYSTLESLLHQRYVENHVNGEWFMFSPEEVRVLFDYLPSSARIFPSEKYPDSIFSTFSNIDVDEYKGRRVFVRYQKLRGNFTPEEREERRRLSIQKQHERKLQKELWKNTTEQASVSLQ